ncbi:YfcC family protein [Jannaschia donghaensis]|uniref:C4-dicarboxylate anaerobic carrier n=1 Tax=Jannaschia donghaensis TaxID=420998 RepID=A0A0M6YMT7_9RHOB|nr:YfcC family protein [Jannaschia donghaensis]CTQ50346.1 C4-dicarboxylate anaerobic carrier [Jannaschia donghaensis]
MADASPDPVPTADRFPSAFTILFGLVIVVAAASWFVPAGEYTRQASALLGRDVPLPGTYTVVDPAPQGLWAVLRAPIAGFYDPESYDANAIDVSLFVLIIGGFLGVVNATGAIDAGITAAMARMRGREKWMIPVLMALFALGGTTYGMAEETLAFYAILIPVMIAAGYDALTGVAVILLGAGVGVLGSTINPFATTIASDAAGIAFTDGIGLRVVILILGWLICTWWVMRYAARVKADPTRSLVADRRDANARHFHDGAKAAVSLTGLRKLVLALFGATFAVMIWGVASQGWWMAEMSMLFLAAAIVIGLAGRVGEKNFVEAFVNGARDLLGVALIIGLARGIVVVMDAGKMTDTLLHAAEGMVTGVSEVVYVNVLFWIETALSFLVPSTSGLAVLTMPILAPASDFAGVDRSLAVTAYQSASGIVNLVTPTSAVVVGALAIGRVPFNRWVRFVAPLLGGLIVLVMGALTLGVLL